jgi:serine/threonine protein phosphatase PrpC
MNIIKFNMAARCEAAGRPNNEDNFQLSDDLTGDQWSFVTDSEVALGKKGALLIVCDGMGGTNAGEVASQLAVESIKEWFSSERLTKEATTTSASIMRYIEKAIIAADARIKEEGKKDIEREGMGSTIVLAWIIGQSAFVGWCGDSRAYRFNPVIGLTRLSHDHSYVQDLVDSGQLSEASAFDHPYSNIITRSLGDPSQTAIPDVKEYSIHDGDVILLCSDGLSGVLRDNSIEALMRENSGNMSACRDALWDAARNAGWTDNVTLGLCRIVSGCDQKASLPKQAPKQKISAKIRKRVFIVWLIIALTLGFVAGIATERFFITQIINTDKP